jgi:hypothetical protein
MSQTTASSETSAAAEPAEAPATSVRRALTPEDLYALRLVEDPCISPDGATIVYVQQEMDHASYEYRRSLWLIAADGKTPARRFTAGPNDSHARWSPDGKRIAFLRAPGRAVKPASAGSASGMYGTTAQIANAAGVAAIGAAFFAIEAADSARPALFISCALFALAIVTSVAFLSWMRRASA